MIPLATSTFLQVMLAMLIIIPVVILWVAAVVDVLQRHRSHAGLRVAAMIVLILILPIVGPIVYFIIRKPEPVSAEDKYLAEADLRRERSHREAGTGLYR